MIGDTHEHKYAKHIEIVIAFLALFLMGMGIYQITNGQTTGYSTGDEKALPVFDGTGKSTGNEKTGQLYENTGLSTGKEKVEAYKSPIIQIKPKVNVRTGNGGDVSSRSRSYTGGTTVGGNTNSGSTNTVGTSGNTGYGQNTGGNTTGNGFNEAGPVKTQGGYDTSRGASSYGQGGLNEFGAVQTQGYMTNGAGGSLYGTRGLNEAPATLGASQIVPASISKPTSDNVSFKNCAAFTKYHSFGDKGGDVGAIQMFLKEKGYYKGKIDGVYGITTFKAVQAFQKDYSKEILNPWGINEKATGVWYKSTTYKANKIMGCPQPAVYLERVNKLLDY